MNARLAAVVLAGGFSSRMKQFKPLLPLGADTVTDRVISTFLSAGADVYLVAGYRHEDILAGVKSRDITFIYNPDYEQGMFSSIQAGLRRLKPEHQAFFIQPVDIPLVRPATIKKLMAAAAENPGHIIYPAFGGKRGHPPLIPSALIPAILAWQGGGGLKAVLDTQEKTAREVAVADGSILLDMDTPQDYQKILERFRRYELPTDEERREILYTICRLPAERIKHCLKVAEAAAAIARALNTAGYSVDTEIVHAAAGLHDIAKGQPKHDIAGGEVLRGVGFGKVADIVAVHSDLAGGNTALPLEAKVVYIADKLIRGEKPVSLEERYSLDNRPFEVTPEAAEAIKERLEAAKKVKKELEDILERSLEEIIDGGLTA
ncbi:MAG: DVU_1551 family NTP transferase [Dehalococcoidales bacterium]